MQRLDGRPEVVERILLGPGPSPVSPRVLEAMSRPTIGHLDPAFLNIMSSTMDLIKYVYQTNNAVSIPMSGTGSAGMETVFVNVIEPGDKVIVCENGVFGQRMIDVAGRCGAEVIQVNAPWGCPIDPNEVKKAISANKKIKAVAIVHAETSTGVLQPLDEIASLAHEAGALLIVDTVTSLGGVEVPVDKYGLDVVYSGTQKCLSCPPGLSPVTLSDRAVQCLNQRKNKVQSWYLDLSMIQRYWDAERFYHHTAPINAIYGLHEALQLIKEEGLENRFKRHQLNSKALIAGLEAMGMKMLVQPEYRLAPLNTVIIPDGIDDLKVRKALLNDYSIEIGGGLGDLKGKIWRIGLMGYGSTKRNVVLVLTTLANVLADLGYKADIANALAAVREVYQNN
ncbi:MAG: pyridoxal-phosphate-dependent aminotransferase family protein [Bacillota bacterium]|jgi:alanine-glyoxylate transaminase/serine-glyoxylate transaminase/serine-pyruvate transaminase